MPLAFLLDEHLRGDEWTAIRHHDAAGRLPIDAVRVGDPPDLPLGSSDLDILLLAEANGRIVVSLDFKAMARFFVDHLAAGRHSPGVAILKPSASIPDNISYLELAAHAGEAYEFADAARVIPEE